MHLPVHTSYQTAKLSARDFMMLSDAGAFDGYAKSELIEGEIWVVNAVHSWHAKAVLEVGFELKTSLRQIGSNLTVYAGGSVAMSEDSVPEPDVSVGEDNSDGIVPLAKIRLAAEVSDSTIATDLGRKAALYARHGVPEYWVVDRDGQCVHQMWEPGSEGYAQQRAVPFGDVVHAATIDGLSIETASLG